MSTVHLMAPRHRERLRGVQVHLKPQRTTKWNSENGAGPSLGSHHIGQRRLSKNYLTFMPAGTFSAQIKFWLKGAVCNDMLVLSQQKMGIKMIMVGI